MVERRALLQETQMLSHQLQTRHHGDKQRLRVRGVVSLRDELFEQLPLTFHASLALEHLSAHLAELFETLGLEPLASVAQGRGDVGQLPLYSGGRTLDDLLLCLGENECDGIRAEIGQPRVQRKPHRGSPHRLYYRLTR